MKSFSLSNKGMIFTLEAIFALVLFSGFVAYSLFYLETPANLERTTVLTQKIDNSFLILDEQGRINQIIDDNKILPDEKVEQIYALFSELLSPYNIKVLLKEVDNNVALCRETLVYEQCFGDLNVFGSIGEEPSNTTLAHRKYFILRKSPSSECEILGTYGFSPSLSLPKVYFDSDLNVVFAVNLTPSSNLQCDQDIKVDLNMSAYDYGRKPADIVIVMDRSGSMNEICSKSLDIASGSFNNGTYSSSWLGCSNYGNWQDLNTFSIDSNYSDGFIVRTTYSGYNGNCNRPRFRLKNPSGTYYPSSSGTSSSSPVSISVSSPSTGTWTLQGWSDETISYDSDLYKKKISVAKQAARNFVNYSGWLSQDYLGLVSYASSATIDQSLTSDRNAVILKINSLVANGSTATGDAIYKATDEIQANKRIDSYLFQVLLSDGYTNAGSSSYAAALDANSKGITIYTIGFGSDANTVELQYIANVTGGQYYAATDENALQSVYDLIAIEIGASLSINKVRIYDSTIQADVGDCNWVVSSGSGTCSSGTISYSIDYFDDDNPWVVSYTINYPCNNNLTCTSPDKNFPGSSSLLKYKTEEGGTEYTMDWNTNIAQTIAYRELELSLLHPRISSKDIIYVDANITNTGTLASGETKLEFFLNSVSSENLLQEINVPSLSSGSYYLKEGITLSGEGLFYGILNRLEQSPDCPQENIFGFYCYGGGMDAHYFVLEVWAWQ